MSEIDNDLVREMASNLVAKLDEIGASKSYQGIWSFAFVHGYRYDGPTYESELETLRAALNPQLKSAV